MSIQIDTKRFGLLVVNEEEILLAPQGIFGFPNDQHYCLVDTGDETLILWLQSLDHTHVAFPVLEPKIFKPDYTVHLSAAELRDLKLEHIQQSAVLSILTIPEDISHMSANLKAPVVINLTARLIKQVVLQENEYHTKHEMFKELRAHLITFLNHKKTLNQKSTQKNNAIHVKDLPRSCSIKNLS